MKVRTLQTSFLMIVGMGILFYSLMSFAPACIGRDQYGREVHWGKHYQTEQQIWGAVGAGLIVLGIFVDDRER